MKVASGKVRDENRWPLPVVVRPRGLREILWTIALVATVIFALEIAGGAYSLCAVAFTTFLIRPTRRAQLKMMTIYFLMGLIWCQFSGGFLEYPKQVLDAIRWFSGSDQSIKGLLVRICVVMPFAQLALITILFYDRRWVDRRRVDERLWKRQVTRRKQILRHWHAHHTVKEVGH
jgi:hypothetical protein